MLPSKTVTPPAHWRPADTAALLFFTLAGFLSRLPFLSPLIDSHDAANYAFALVNYDVGLHQPQPPGYPLYILLARAALLITAGDARLALVGLSAVMSGLAAGVAYLMGRAMGGRAAGLATALLLSTSPFVWAQGTAPLPYATDLFFSLLTGWACHRAALADRHDVKAALLAGATLGLAALLRQQNAVILGPLLLHALWAKPLRSWVVGLATAGLLTGLALLLPPLLSSGGLQSYGESLARMAPSPGGSLAPGGQVRASRLYRLFTLFMGYGGGTAGLAGLPLFLAGAALLMRRLARHGRAARLLLLWALPAWAFFLLVKQGSQSTVLLITPPVFLTMGLATAWLWRLGSPARWLGPALALGLALHHALGFCTELPLPLGRPHLRHRAAALDLERRDLTLRLQRLRHLSPGDTAIIARAARVISYHLPEWEVYSPPRFDLLKPRRIKEVVRHHQGSAKVMVNVGSPEVIHPGTRHLVLFDIPFRPTRGSSEALELLGLRHPLMKVVKLARGARVTVHSKGMDLE